MITIYALSDPRTDTIRYAGKAVILKRRIQNHLCPSNVSKKRHVTQWLKSLTDSGVKPKVVVLEEVEGDWEPAEKKWILFFKALGFDLTNTTAGGNGGSTGGRVGKPWSKQQHENYSKTRTGMKVNYNYEGRRKGAATNRERWRVIKAMGGKKAAVVHTPEAMRKICDAAAKRRGVPLTEEHKQKLRLAKLGKKHTESHNANIRAAYARKRKEVIDVDSNLSNQ